MIIRNPARSYYYYYYYYYSTAIALTSQNNY